MANKVTWPFVLLTVPMDVLEDSGIDLDGVLQFTAEDGKIVIETVSPEDVEDYLCDGDCESCPLSE